MNVIDKIKHKIETESPIDFNKASRDVKKQIVETFYRIVLDELEVNKIRAEFDINLFETHFKNFIPFSPITNFDEINSKLPNPTDKFIKKSIIQKSVWYEK